MSNQFNIRERIQKKFRMPAAPETTVQTVGVVRKNPGWEQRLLTLNYVRDNVGDVALDAMQKILGEQPVPEKVKHRITTAVRDITDKFVPEKVVGLTDSEVRLWQRRFLGFANPVTKSRMSDQLRDAVLEEASVYFGLLQAQMDGKHLGQLMHADTGRYQEFCVGIMDDLLLETEGGAPDTSDGAVITEEDEAMSEAGFNDDNIDAEISEAVAANPGITEDDDLDNGEEGFLVIPQADPGGAATPMTEPRIGDENPIDPGDLISQNPILNSSVGPAALAIAKDMAAECMKHYTEAHPYGFFASMDDQTTKVHLGLLPAEASKPDVLVETALTDALIFNIGAFLGL